MNEKVNPNEFDELAIILKAMSHPTRLWILKFLAEQNCCISGEISDELPFAKSTVSEHLRQLKKAGLIQGEFEHPKIKYCINKSKWDQTKKLLNDFFDVIIEENKVSNCKN